MALLITCLLMLFIDPSIGHTLSDKHTCLLYFYPEGYISSEVYLAVTSEKVSRNFYIENGGWDFVDSNVKVINSDNYVELRISITLQRKPRYVIINIILPIIFFAYLSNVVFVIPADCGERISYSITVLLAIAVYLTIVSDNLPKSSFPMSYFSYYLLSMLVTSILITMATIFNLRIIHTDDSDSISGIWAKLALCFKSTKPKERKKYTEKTDSDYKREKHEHEIQGHIHHVVISNMYEATEIQEPKCQGRRLENKGNVEMTSPSDDIDRDETVTWKDVSIVLDKIFFLIFFIVLSAATIVYVVVIAKEQYN